MCLAIMLATGNAFASAPQCRFRVLRSYPHASTAFTEGLLFRDGLLHESTGNIGTSRISVRRLDRAEPVRSVAIDSAMFGEGLVDWNDQLISLTWRDGVGYRWDRATLRPLGRFPFVGEGWGMTRIGDEIVQSDGSSSLIFRDPATMAIKRTIDVTWDGDPVRNLNELESIEGLIWANVWLTDRIVLIRPDSGAVVAWIDVAGLRALARPAPSADAVPNGIAYDQVRKRIFVTGKLWPKLFEIRLDRGCPSAPGEAKRP